MLKLLSETRRACFRVSLLGAIVLILLVFLQTVSGALTDAVIPGWLWAFGIAIPALLALWVSLLLNRYPTKLFQSGTHWALVGGSAAYYTLALLTLLAEPFATRGERSIVGYLTQSYDWLLPLEAILLGGYFMAFFRKESLFRPNAQLILDFAARKATDWEQKGNPIRQQCFELIAANDLPGVFDLLKTQFGKSNPEALKAAILLENQYRDTTRQRDLTLVEDGPAQVALNKIYMGIMNIVEKL
jgi:hypothetical protein